MAGREAHHYPRSSRRRTSALAGRVLRCAPVGQAGGVRRTATVEVNRSRGSPARPGTRPPAVDPRLARAWPRSSSAHLDIRPCGRGPLATPNHGERAHDAARPPAARPGSSVSLTRPFAYVAVVGGIVLVSASFLFMARAIISTGVQVLVGMVLVLVAVIGIHDAARKAHPQPAPTSPSINPGPLCRSCGDNSEEVSRVG
ncbi:DUF6234 family protein [Streptomyces sp. NPDC058001]|uniref:DUF6234 family protein n=1 Tax=Streptomyces sp. NPDC058001 TaxID=3346300 RepID=UPI0036E59E27